ncbi:unnamed protein product [Clonostachys rhizophaga]|uniref:Uncharacterized protein n=1 Tax=Clonostachys rhizophaga TaxID=160324 RepID=A0A9N9YRA8_9HYPO|nr:unnamed protein product [Clonostachys rhizophaga]
MTRSLEELPQWMDLANRLDLTPNQAFTCRFMGHHQANQSTRDRCRLCATVWYLIHYRTINSEGLDGPDTDLFEEMEHDAYATIQQFVGVNDQKFPEDEGILVGSARKIARRLDLGELRRWVVRPSDFEWALE